MRTAERERLLRVVITLRGAELAGAPEAVGDVRDDLEQMVGPTVTRALAARVLGVSQTALDRHVRSGAIPLIMRPDGRYGVPVGELVRIALEVERFRAGGARHPLAATLAARAERARAVPVTRIVEADGSVPTGHRPAELRSLAYHRAIAERLDHQLVVDARRLLRRWHAGGIIHDHWAEHWERILALPEDELRRAIVADDQRGRDLRQSSPFAGALPDEERPAIMALPSRAA